MPYKLQPSQNLINIIKSEEAFRPSQYKDGGSNAIGYGNHYIYPNGIATPLPSNYGPITEQEAEELAITALTRIMNDIKPSITANLTQYQFEALTSVAYNCGPGTLKSSQLLGAVNRNPNDQNIRNLFIDCHAQSQGLKNRRVREFNYYSTGIPDYKSGYTPINKSIFTNSKTQVEYSNTNYCNSIICTEDIPSYSSGVYGSAGGGYEVEKSEPTPSNQFLKGSKAANVFLEMFNRGYRINSWEYVGPLQKSNGVCLKCGIRHEEYSNKVGEFYCQILSNNSYGVSIKAVADDGTLPVSDFRNLILEYSKSDKNTINYNEFENKINEKVHGVGDSMFDVLYENLRKKRRYQKLHFHCFDDSILNESLYKGKIYLFYFKDIQVSGQCTDKEAEGIGLSFGDNKLVRFRIGKNRGNNGGWDNIHMIRK